jgi:hypothetical protein
VFMGLYECLAEPALEHVRQVVARHAPELGEEITILRPASAHADPSGTTEDSSIRTP